jgi:hypothetical protein
LFGYSVRTVQLNKRQLDTKPDVKEHPTGKVNPPRAVSLGVHCLQGVLCISQANGVLNQECGLGYRLCRRMAKPRSRVLWQFRIYMEYLLWRLFPDTIPADYDFSPKSWTLKTHYPLWRCAQLLLLVPEIPQVLNSVFFRKYGACKAFIKLENYTNGTIFEFGDYKPPRVISSRTDHVKVAIGPAIKAIEERVYQLPYFIKHVPIPDRPRYITEHVQTTGCRYMASDYTSFECGFTPAFMHVCEFALYRHMLRNCPHQRQSMKWFERQCTGINKVHMSDVTCYMAARRQSGEMTTSLGNGFSNLAMTAFNLRDVIDIKDLRCVVEGDDGLFAIPSQFQHLVDPARYEDLGFMIKSEWHDEVNLASFCGLVYDVHDGINLTNPIDEILSVGWSLGENIRSSDLRLSGLLIAKTYSLIYEYSGCPIIYKLARWLARCKGLKFDFSSLLNSRSWSSWEREKWADMQLYLSKQGRSIATMLLREPTIGSRLAMEQVYGVTVSDQRAMEAYFDAQKTIHPIDLPIIIPYLSPMAKAFTQYVHTFPVGTSWTVINDFMPG